MLNGLRNLKTISAIVLDRIELYSKLLTVEAKIETTLMVRRIAWASVGIIFAIFTIAMLHMAVLGYFWSSEYRSFAIIAVLIADALIAGISLYIASKPALQDSFEVTKHQLAEDIKFIKESI